MTTVKETIDRLQEIARENQANPALRIVEIPYLEEGECYRQGDLNIFKVPENHPVGKEVDRRQLADGTSIGQRHVLLGGKFKVYQGVKAPEPRIGKLSPEHQQMFGYAFDILEIDDGSRNGHPEHTHFVFKQTGRYQVLHQLDWQTRQKMAD